MQLRLCYEYTTYRRADRDLLSGLPRPIIRLFRLIVERRGVAEDEGPRKEAGVEKLTSISRRLKISAATALVTSVTCMGTLVFCIA